MQLYLLFILMATLTILSPGPGVLKSVTNSLNYGFKRAFIGVIGLSTGTFCVAVLSATSLGALLAASDTGFTVIKYFGAAYLIYMGIKLWRAPAFEFKDAAKEAISNKKLFAECFIFQLSNPKALVFFLSVFPQFIEHDRSYLGQFTVLVLTFCLLLVLVHSVYALFAHKAKSWFTSAHGGRWANRVGGTAFIGFGLLLANAKKTG